MYSSKQAITDEIYSHTHVKTHPLAQNTMALHINPEAPALYSQTVS